LRRFPPVDELADGVRAGDRSALGRSITLVESTRRDHQDLAQQLLTLLLPDTGRSHRIGISGVPGVGKSTFIEVFGRMLTAQGHRVAVLAVDPTSSISRGSILGDKTRMPTLATDTNAFIRPSPTSGTLGGVAAKTRETMLLCEAAGFDVVLVETVGVGQSETLVAGMVDFFAVLMLAGAGDDLQGIKRGILELADLIAINKADGDNLKPAMRARTLYEMALHHLTPISPNWQPPVQTCSATQREGLPDIWDAMCSHRDAMHASGEFASRRRQQAQTWMWALVEGEIRRRLREDPSVAAQIDGLEEAVAEGRQTAGTAASGVIVKLFGD
jgi:LAO/AO transport system kinase